MATAKKTTTKRAAGPGGESPGVTNTIRGVALVERCIEAIAAKRSPKRAAKPVPAEVLAALRFDNGREIPASLRRWLAFDGTGFVIDKRARTLKTGNFSDIFPEVIEEYGDDADPGNPANILRAFDELLGYRLCPLDGRFTAAMHYFCLGKPDRHGEYPIALVTDDEQPIIALEYPGFDMYLAHQCGLIEPDAGVWPGDGALARSPSFRQAFTEQEALNLKDGKLYFDDVLAMLEKRATRAAAGSRPASKPKAATKPARKPKE